MSAEHIARALGGAQRSGPGWVCRCCCHEDRRPSLSLRDGVDGRLLAYCFVGCDVRAILAELRKRGLLEELQREDRPRPPSKPNPDEHAAKMARIALLTWQTTEPAAGSPVEFYLRNRGYNGEIPPALRFHRKCLYKPNGQYLPAMVAEITRPDGSFGGIQRTWLTTAEPIRKAPVAENKKSLGRCAGGAVRLAEAGPTVTVAEGIENALSLMCASSLPVWASCGTKMMQRVELPPLPLAALVIIGADSDVPGEAAAQQAAQRWLAEGRRVRIARPPTGKDWNDILLESGGASIEEVALAGR